MFKRVAIIALKMIISVGLISFLFYKLGLGNVFQQIKTARFSWFLVGMLIFTVSNLLGALQWYLLLRLRNVHLPFIKVLSIYYVGLFFNNFLMGYVGGDAFRIYDITRASGKSEAAVSTVFFDRFIGFALLTTLALCAVLYWSQFMESNGILIIIGLIFIGWVFLFIMLFNTTLVKSTGWFFGKILPQKWHFKLKKISIGIYNFRHHKQQLLGIVCLSLVIQIIRILVHYVAARSVGVHIPVIYFIIFVPVIALLASLPISIGGIGIRESSGIAFFAPFWKVNADIVAFEFIAFLIGAISAIPGGILFMLRRELRPQEMKGD